MNRFGGSVKKEYLLLISDWVGLLFMFVLPLVLVFLLTVVQESTFRKVNDNQISLLIVSHDEGKQSAALVDLLRESGFFAISENHLIVPSDIKEELIRQKMLAAIYIPEDFSEKLIQKSYQISNMMLADMMLTEKSDVKEDSEMPEIQYFHDPVLQETYNYTIMNVLHSFINIIENSLMLDVVYEELGFEETPEDFRDAMMNNRVNITQTSASTVNIVPNTTQHNVPAWTIFAMFFMVISLGSNIVKERTNGSFTRLKTMPVNFALVFGSKTAIYVMVAILQVIVIFSVGVYAFPSMQLPRLVMPDNLLALLLIVIVTALSAVSYALMIGSLAKTQEQANGVGAVSIIIFAALGGIFVPVFLMPDALKMVCYFSPLYWCMEGFYILFLKGGNFLTLLLNMLPLIGFILVCQAVTYMQLKSERVV